MNNKREFYRHEVPPGFRADDVEFFVMNGEVQFIQNHEIHLFNEITIDIAMRLRNELEADPRAMIGIELLGIHEPNEQIEKFAFCRYGYLNSVPDLEQERKNPQYRDCGLRPCPADGYICKFPKVPNGHLTLNDIDIIREIRNDLPNKIIADHRHRSVDTINKECHSIAGKIGCFTKTGIAVFAGENNI